MTEIYSIFSESGDEYKLKFTTDRSGIIADALLDGLNSEGIEVAETFYFHVIYRKRHQRYAEMIAEAYQKDFGKPE